MIRQKLAELIADYTKDWCEKNVIPMVEWSASIGAKNPSFTLWLSGTKDSKNVYALKLRPSRYADNRTEAEPISETIHLPTLKKHLEELGYNIEPLYHHDFWQYGAGRYDGYYWKVSC